MGLLDVGSGCCCCSFLTDELEGVDGLDAREVEEGGEVVKGGIEGDV